MGLAGYYFPLAILIPTLLLIHLWLSARSSRLNPHVSLSKPLQGPTGKQSQTQPVNKAAPEETPASRTSPAPKEKTSPANTETPAQALRRQNWAIRKAAIKAYRQYLIENYPTLFGNELKPLKIGIHKELNQTRGPHTKKTLHSFMHGHTQSKAYLQTLIKGGPRYDLNDQPAGIVTEAQQQTAQQALERLEAKSQPTKT